MQPKRKRDRYLAAPSGSGDEMARAGFGSRHAASRAGTTRSFDVKYSCFRSGGTEWRALRVVALLEVGGGIVGALALAGVLRSLLAEVSSTDPVTFIGIAVLLLGVAAGAWYIPAHRASKMDPTAALHAAWTAEAAPERPLTRSTASIVSEPEPSPRPGQNRTLKRAG